MYCDYEARHKAFVSRDLSRTDYTNEISGLTAKNMKITVLGYSAV
jgi:hypothetical protein